MRVWGGGTWDIETLKLFIPEDLSDSQEIHLYDTDLYDLVILKGRDLVIDADVREADIFVDKRYKAGINRVSPRKERKTFEARERCILLFSLQQPNFEGTKLDAIVEWIDRRFKECEVFIGDCIHHHTLQMNLGIEEDTAKREAYRLAHEIAKQDPFRRATRCHFSIVFGSTLQDDPNYMPTRERLWDLKDANADFAQAVQGFAKAYVQRRDVDVTRYLPYSTNYLLDELALLACMSEKGNKVMIYPGGLEIFHQISDGKHPDAPPPLRESINVELKFHIRGGAQHK
uniref:Cyclodipeptide synthase n=1 Tax=Candidatus Kentrum sp. FW TaxID=2126338 RepID=A0A450RT35_9GAMM|nr:MAG: tRNA-dependent cyclodipeptide synthase [Candidatus Kentron sp. FW]